jgi:hypothetical protein
MKKKMSTASHNEIIDITFQNGNHLDLNKAKIMHITRQQQ